MARDRHAVTLHCSNAKCDTEDEVVRASESDGQAYLRNQAFSIDEDPKRFKVKQEADEWYNTIVSCRKCGEQAEIK
jgi:hypothetical protein